MDSHGGCHLYEGVTSLVYVTIFFRWNNKSVETVITAATTHLFDKKADDLTKGHGIHFNYISSENAYQYYVTANKSKQ